MTDTATETPAAAVRSSAPRPPGPGTLRRVLTGLLWLPALAVLLLAVVGPWLVPGDAGRIVGGPYAPPGPGLPLGTDAIGRDVWDRFLAGGRPLVIVPLVATVLTTVVGTLLGVLAGYLGGRVAAVMTWLDSLLLALPPIVVLLALLHGLGYSAVTLLLAVAATGVPFVSRISRAATTRVVRTGYVDQAVALGDGPLSVVVREIVPNILQPVLADAGTRLAVAIALTASADFLGFGPGTPSWAAMVSENMEGVTLVPWGVAVPALGISVLTVAANLLLDRLAAKGAS
ncbi:ABC transporter permease [Kitasatospora griseola]|uniref:ABC transporter permease n=1 Tax=Kitasatospora griseola TaxID=2064 RepID=UPI00380CDBA0